MVLQHDSGEALIKILAVLKYDTATLPNFFRGSSFGYFSFKKSNTRLPRLPDKSQFTPRRRAKSVRRRGDLIICIIVGYLVICVTIGIIIVIPLSIPLRALFYLVPLRLGASIIYTIQA